MVLSGSVDNRLPSESWRRHLEKPSSHGPHDDVREEDPFQAILDDVQHYPPSVIKSACLSLQELLTSARVESRLVQSLDSVRLAPQLHAGLKLLISRLNPATKKVVPPQLLSWNALCVKTAPPSVVCVSQGLVQETIS